MSTIDTVKTLMTALEANDFDVAEDLLADDFVMDGWTPQILDKKGFFQVIKGLKEGIPGLIFNLHNAQEYDNTVQATWQVVGYQTDTFNIPILSLPPIPQMGRSVSLPTEDVEFTANNDLITRLLVKPSSGGGIRGLLQQLGTDSTLAQ